MIHSLGLDVETWTWAVSVSKIETWSRYMLIPILKTGFWLYPVHEASKTYRQDIEAINGEPVPNPQNHNYTFIVLY
jgi:hypothetical protein